MVVTLTWFESDSSSEVGTDHGVSGVTASGSGLIRAPSVKDFEYVTESVAVPLGMGPRCSVKTVIGLAFGVCTMCV